LKLKDFSDCYHNCPKLVGYALVSASIALFAPYMFTVMLSSFVAIMAPEDLPVLRCMALLGESFLIQYITTIPATVLLILGVVKLKNED